MLDPEHSTFQYASRALISRLHLPFIFISPDSPGDVTADQSSDTSQISADEVVRLLARLIANTDPSPTLIPCLLTPILAELYALSEHLQDMRTADPTSQQTVMALLSSWGKIVPTEEGVASLWNVVSRSPDIHWNIDVTGSYTRIQRSICLH
jgi:hypothetical protein